MSQDVYVAVAKIIVDQPWWARRKETILTVLNGLVWACSVLGAMNGVIPVWGVAVIGAVGSACAALVIALTKAAVTPSMAARIAAVMPAEPVFDLDAERSKLAG